MLRGVVPVPSVALGVVARRDVLQDVVRLDVLVRELGALLTRPLEAVGALVRQGAAVLAGALAVLLGGGPGFGAAVVPVVEFVGGVVVLRSTLMV